MKLLDPFAGYRLASGHFLFHLSCFVCSFGVEFTKAPVGDYYSDDIDDAFRLVRWAHFCLFILAMFEIYANHPSPLSEKNDDIDDDLDQ